VAAILCQLLKTYDDVVYPAVPGAATVVQRAAAMLPGGRAEQVHVRPIRRRRSLKSPDELDAVKDRLNEWTSKDGERRSKIQVVAVQFLGKPTKAGDPDGGVAETDDKPADRALVDHRRRSRLRASSLRAGMRP
jgi:hypothetical protein